MPPQRTPGFHTVVTVGLLTLGLLSGPGVRAADFPLHLGTYLDSTPATPLGLAIAEGGALAIGLARQSGSEIQLRRPDDGSLLDTLAPGAGLNFLRGESDGPAWVATGDFGVAISDAGGLAIARTLPADDFATTPTRAARCGGRLVVLAGSQVTLLDTTGNQLDRFTVSATSLADVACSAADNLSYVTGYRQVSGNLQMAFVEAHGPGQGLVWRAWGHSASEAQNEGLGSDTRGRVLRMGADGFLYFAGSSSGGVPVYRRDPQNIAQSASNIDFDRHNQTFNLGDKRIIYYARLAPASGALQAGQFLLTRLSSGAGNSVGVDSLAIDNNGELHLGGRAFASLDGRNNLSVAGQAVTPYSGGDPHLLVVPASFQARSHWTTFIGPSGRGTVVAVASRDGRHAFLISATQGELLTVKALIDADQLSADPTAEAPFAYLGSWGQTDYIAPGEILRDDFESP